MSIICKFKGLGTFVGYWLSSEKEVWICPPKIPVTNRMMTYKLVRLGYQYKLFFPKKKNLAPENGWSLDSRGWNERLEFPIIFWLQPLRDPQNIPWELIGFGIRSLPPKELDQNSSCAFEACLKVRKLRHFCLSHPVMLLQKWEILLGIPQRVSAAESTLKRIWNSLCLTFTFIPNYLESEGFLRG